MCVCVMCIPVAPACLARLRLTFFFFFQILHPVCGYETRAAAVAGGRDYYSTRVYDTYVYLSYTYTVIHRYIHIGTIRV